MNVQCLLQGIYICISTLKIFNLYGLVCLSGRIYVRTSVRAKRQLAHLAPNDPWRTWWKCNFPITPPVRRRPVGRSVRRTPCLSVISYTFMLLSDRVPSTLKRKLTSLLKIIIDTWMTVIKVYERKEGANFVCFLTSPPPHHLSIPSFNQPFPINLLVEFFFDWSWLWERYLIFSMKPLFFQH